MIQGGVLIFDQQGVLQYAYEEQVGQELELQDIAAAMEQVALLSNQNK